MSLSESAEEILEMLWISWEEKGKDPLIPNGLGQADESALNELMTQGYITASENQVALTPKGRLESAAVVRRHRLAERLLTDVIDAREVYMEERACKFEHLIDRDLDESICTLLGHPKICPHGKPIPPGGCCRSDESHAPRLVYPLSELLRGQKGRIAYVYAPESAKLQKLISMGILPGATVSLIESFPSYVFEAGQTQFAVDKETADSIYVRLAERNGSSQIDNGDVTARRGWRRRWYDSLRRGGRAK